jgi:hypothetical protein
MTRPSELRDAPDCNVNSRGRAGSEEPRGTERNREEPRGTAEEPQRNREEPRGTERNREEPRGTERNREEPRGTERNREEPQRNRRVAEVAERRRGAGEMEERNHELGELDELLLGWWRRAGVRRPSLDVTRISFRAIGVILPVPEGRAMLAVGFLRRPPGYEGHIIPRLGVGRKPRRVSDG